MLLVHTCWQLLRWVPLAHARAYHVAVFDKLQKVAYLILQSSGCQTVLPCPIPLTKCTPHYDNN